MAKRRMKNALTAMGFPETVSPYASDIHIIGTGEVSLEGCSGILEYENERIVLRTRNNCVIINGDRLTMRSFFGNHIRVIGNIDSVAFSEEK